MNTTKRKFALAFAYLVALASIAKAQPGTLEMTSLGSSNSFSGPSVAPVVVTFTEDATNATAGTIFQNQTATPALTVTASLGNQQYNSTFGNISTGMAFGAANTGSTGGNVQMATPVPVYNILGATLAQAPANGMFVSSPTGTIVANYQAGGRGVGLDVEATQGGKDFTSTGADDYNFGIAVFNSVEPLYAANLPKAGRYYYGTLTLTFNRPVINPVVHIGGMGGSYSYLPTTAGAVPLISYFSTELELQNTGVTSTFMAGNENFNIVGNNILNSATKPNGGSYNDGQTQNGFPVYGAATGSVRINGTVTQLTYNVYVRGSASSDFNFSKNQSSISAATRAPLNGDLFYVAVSLDKPNQQISGNIFDDADGLTDNNINQSGGVANPKTNVSGALYANLLNPAGNVVASTPVTADGAYLFNNIPNNTYTVQITTNSSTGTFASPVAAPATVLPTGWVNTGENNSASTGSDGTIDGKSAAVVIPINTIKTNINFGIERLPDSKSFTSFIHTPQLNSYLPLKDTLPLLTGSDPEDKPVEGTLGGKTIKFTALPANSQLQYNNVAVTLNQVITNYDVSLLRIFFNQATALSSTQFSYAYVDAAGKADPTPATYLLNWASGGPLAVVLKDFTAIGSDCSAKINWTASNEQNLASYVIEVSVNNQSSFTTASTVTPVGSNTDQSYQTTYAMKSGVVYYYRLKLVNNDGSFTTSPIRILSCGGKVAIVVAPNPVVDQFTISGMADGKNTVAVFAADGKMMMQQILSGNTGTMNISRFTAGTYVVRIVAQDGTVFTTQIIKR